VRGRHDDGPPHALKWTSIFLCPSTGEVFPSGRYGDVPTYVVRAAPDPASSFAVVWFGKKTLAEHAAACRALDCIRFREASAASYSSSYERIGLDEPYMAPMMTVPSHVPIKQRMDIQQHQSQILQLNPPPTAGSTESIEDQHVKDKLQQMRLSSASPSAPPLLPSSIPVRPTATAATTSATTTAKHSTPIPDKTLHDDIFGDA
jgi:hypothetical protein